MTSFELQAVLGHASVETTRRYLDADTTPGAGKFRVMAGSSGKLPPLTSSFVGRTNEIADLMRILSHPPGDNPGSLWDGEDLSYR